MIKKFERFENAPERVTSDATKGILAKPTRRKAFRVSVSLVPALVCAILAVAFPTNCQAGGGPENLVLVVNADSAASKLLANYYIVGRQIPSRNVIYLNGIPAREVSSLDVFREKIFKPVLQQIAERKLGNSVDYIVYSADFPSSYNISPITKQLAEEMKKNTPPQTLPSNIYGPYASLTSQTYYAGPVL